jgi:hypothetical protein
LSRKVNIALRRSPAPLLEGVEHIDGLCELSDIEDSMLKRGVDANLSNTGADLTHFLPVRWLQPLLDTPQLKPGQSACVTREGTDVGT